MKSEIEISSILQNDNLKDDWKQLLSLLPSAYQEDLSFKLLLDWHIDAAGRVGETGYLFSASNSRLDPHYVNLYSALLKATQKWRPLIDYQSVELILLHARVDLRGKTLLEIGGCMPNEILFDDLLIKSYISVEAPDYIDAEMADDFDHYNSFQDAHVQKRSVFVKAEDLSSVIPPDSIDHIFSTACFEHIYDLPKALIESQKCLKVGGTLYSFFAPIYSHIAEGDHHTVPQKKFKSPPVGIHLLSFSDQRRYLEESGINDPAEIEKILGRINFNRIPNRLLYEDYEAILTESPLAVMELKRIENYNISKIYPQELERIRSSNPIVRNVSTLGFRIHMIKI